MSVGTSRPSGQAPGITIDAYANGSDIGTITGGSSHGGNAVAASSEMVLQMLDTLMTGHEPFYADYPAYQEAEPLTQPHHQHSHQHAISRNTSVPPVPLDAISRNTSVPPVSLDATTHTPGTPRNTSPSRNPCAYTERTLTLRRTLLEVETRANGTPTTCKREFNIPTSHRSFRKDPYGTLLRHIVYKRLK